MHAETKSACMSLSQFHNAFKIIAMGEPHEREALVFRMIDFKNKGKISRADTHTLLSHTIGWPTTKKYTFVLYLVTSILYRARPKLNSN